MHSCSCRARRLRHSPWHSSTLLERHQGVQQGPARVCSGRRPARNHKPAQKTDWIASRSELYQLGRNAQTQPTCRGMAQGGPAGACQNMTHSCTPLGVSCTRRRSARNVRSKGRVAGWPDSARNTDSVSLQARSTIGKPRQELSQCCESLRSVRKGRQRLIAYVHSCSHSRGRRQRYTARA